MYTRFLIGETVSTDQQRELVRKLQQHRASDVTTHDLNAPAAIEILTEDGGQMVILCTHFPDRLTCLKYHSSRSYRQLIEKTSHLLIGEWVVKLFENVTVAAVAPVHDPDGGMSFKTLPSRPVPQPRLTHEDDVCHISEADSF